MTRRGATRGLTLLEVMVSVAVMAMISLLIYGAFDQMTRSKRGLERINDRFHEGRIALARIARELGSAYLSEHVPFQQNLVVQKTILVGREGSPADRVDFTAFAHRRLGRDAHESDQCEISYFGARNPDRSGRVDLVRREQAHLDLEPDRGGVVNVLVEDIDLFDVQYLDPVSGEWTSTWDTTQAAGQPGRLPLQAKITLVLNGGPGGKPVTFSTKVSFAMQTALRFAQ